MQPDEQPEQQQQRGRGRRQVQVKVMNKDEQKFSGAPNQINSCSGA